MKEIDKRKIIETHYVTGLKTSQNIYDYLPGKLKTLPSRKGVKKAFGRDQVIVNGKKVHSSHRVENRDTIEILEYLKAVTKVFPLDLTVVFQDEYLAIVEKPPGLPTSGNRWKTLQNALPVNIERSTQEDALSVPLTVHRLDAKTHGLVIVAKTAGTRIALGEMFKKREINKKYLAIVQGRLEGSGNFSFPVQGKSAKTFYRAIEHFRQVKDVWNTIVELSPVTGRKHQLRVHLSEAGHPIVGDVKYSEKGDVLKGKGLFLSANQLEFLHPITNENIKVAIDLPAKFQRYIERSKKWYDRIDKGN